MIISSEFVQKSPQQRSKPNKKLLLAENEAPPKRKAFNYFNEEKCESPIKEINGYDPQHNTTFKVEEKEIKARCRKYDIRQLLIKVKEHAKKCKDKYNNKNLSELGTDDYFQI